MLIKELAAEQNPGKKFCYPKLNFFNPDNGYDIDDDDDYQFHQISRALLLQIDVDAGQAKPGEGAEVPLHKVWHSNSSNTGDGHSGI